MAQDEGRFGRISSCRHTWAPPGVRPQAPRQVIREYSYGFRAVAPALGAIPSLILPRANTQMMNVFRQHMAHEDAAYVIVMQVDRAGWHQAKDVGIPDTSRCLPQPAHSPELNPVEHIWEQLPEQHFHNRAFPSLDAVEETLIGGLNRLDQDPDHVRSMTYFPHFRNLS